MRPETETPLSLSLSQTLSAVRLHDRQPATLMVRHDDDPVNERAGEERERERERERESERENLRSRRNGMDGNFSSSELISQSRNLQLS